MLLLDYRAFALLMAATLTVMSNATISPALPGLQAEFSANPNAEFLTRLLVTAPSLIVAVLAPFAGAAADRFGRRRQLLLGILIYGLAGTAGLWLNDLTSILASRLLLGAAVALVMTAQSALIGDYFAGETRGRFMGYQLAATNFGGFVFIITAGWLATESARLPFAIYGLAFLYLPLIWSFLPKPDPSGADVDNTAIVTRPDWHSVLAGLALMSGATFVIFYILPTQIPFFLVEMGIPEPSAAAFVLSALTLAGGVSALFFGRVRPLLGDGVTPAVGYILMAIGFFTLASGSSLLQFILGGGIIGGGLGLVMPNFMTAALNVVPANRRGLASGVLTTSIFLGQFLSPVVSTPVVFEWGYRSLLFAAGSCGVLLAACALFSFRRAFAGEEAA
tara:strand:+ start:10039 stop:11214 length:1176 start_codon:yes stop_codon:yes gene_type:complete